MKKGGLLFFSIFSAAIILIGCNKDTMDCSADVEFCSFIDKGDYHSTQLIINEYLDSQKKKLSNSEKLEQLGIWLECKSCISKVDLICNSCIETNPPKSELKVLFIIDGQHEEKTLDIIMEKPLKVGEYHD